MNLDEIRFFSPQENKSERKAKAKEETGAPATGYISATGKVIIPQKAAEEVGLNTEHTTYMVGTEQNKRKLKSLYVIPASGHTEGAFEMVSSGRNNFISLGVILEKSGLDYQNNKYTFEVSPFVFGDDIKGIELKLNKPTLKAKRAGRKPKNQE